MPTKGRIFGGKGGGVGVPLRWLNFAPSSTTGGTAPGWRGGDSERWVEFRSYCPAATSFSFGGKSRGRTRLPKVWRKESTIDIQLVLDLARLAIDFGRPTGMRFCASAYLLMIFAPLRFSDFKAVFGIWRTERSIGGRTLYLDRSPRPILLVQRQVLGFIQGEIGSARCLILGNQTPSGRGASHFIDFLTTDWKSTQLDDRLITRYWGCSVSCVSTCGMSPNWAIDRPRAWFPTRANQLGRSEGERRRLGHWAPGSKMIDAYD